MHSISPSSPRSFTLRLIRRMPHAVSLLIFAGFLPFVAHSMPDTPEARPGQSLSWPSQTGRTYQAQWAATASGPWNNLGAVRSGSGGMLSVNDFDAPGPRHYRILETVPGSAAGPSIVVNGGFEEGSGPQAEDWTAVASQPPVRSDADARTGSYSMRARIINTTASANEGLLSQRLSEAGSAVTGGKTYDFSFHAKQVSVGPSYIQQYEVQWLNADGGVADGTGLVNFTATTGSWQEIRVDGLAAPVGATDALIRFRFVTGAVAGGEGEVFIDDVSLASTDEPTPGETFVLEPERQRVLEISWLSRTGVPYQPMVSHNPGDPASWSPFGPVVTGTGATRSVVVPMTSNAVFMRIGFPGEPTDPGEPGDPIGPFDIVPLFSASTPLEPDYQIETDEALITYIGDRARDRHAREGTGTVPVNNFDAYDHFLPFYWEERTLGVEIIDRVAKGGTTITYNYTTVIPLSAPEFRVFFRGLGTVAEYHFNTLGTLIDPATNTYSVTIDRNHQFNRALQMGDRIEMEISLFLDGPANGRTNYYGTTLLYIVGRGIVPWQTAQTAGLPYNNQGERLDSYPIPEEGWLGGETTLPYRYTHEPEHLFKQFAGNAAPQSAEAFLLGRRLHHTDFGDGSHSEPGNPAFTEHIGKLGPAFNARSCVECHVNNGRSFPSPVGEPMHFAVIRAGADAAGTPHPVLGETVQTQSTTGTPEATVRISGYTYIDGQYGDGTPYELRKPEYTFEGEAPEFYSVRMARPLVGLGLLEAVAEETILALADPDDDSNDGISGRPRIVTDPETGDPRLGRFGHKGGSANLRQQVASAFYNDMGVTTTVYPGYDGPELNDKDLDDLTLYIAVLGVQARRDLNSPVTILGHEMFVRAGCVQCHVPELTTGPYHPSAELRNQTIRPYTDLLLHDMGPDLADNLGEGTAGGSEWRTAPLWNIGHTAAVGGEEAYLHDGRARTLEEAILWHGGEAEGAREEFRTMTTQERDALVAYLRSL
ncbi:MAG: c-type cytochrome [Opitutales bacterium]|nr:c-type cytochrome [Opitutales bacterium]